MMSCLGPYVWLAPMGMIPFLSLTLIFHFFCKTFLRNYV